jgi:hypothetical protein
MEIDGSLVILGLMTSIFTLVGIEMINHNWFKRERFKFNMSVDRKEVDMKLKKMARELGLDKKPISPPETSLAPVGASTMDTIRSLLPLAAKLAPEQLEALIEQFLPMEGGGGGEESPSGIDSLVDFVTKNPEIVRGFMDKLGAKGGSQNQQDNIPSQL